MKPLEITCRVITPIIYYGDGLNLDGILAYGHYRSLSREEQAALPPINGPFAVDFPLPIKKWTAPGQTNAHPELHDGDGNLWGWHTSNVIANWEGRRKHAVRKKADTSFMKRHTREAVVNISSGEFKGKNATFEAWWPKEGLLTWYAFGDMEAVGTLLQQVTNLGKLNNHGLGKIACNLDGSPIWTIMEIEHDLSIKHRAMPVDHSGPHGHGRLLPIRAPRHHRSRYALCIDGPG